MVVTIDIDFDGTVDGQPFPGMKADGFKLELGSKSFVDTFEEQLAGLKAGGALRDFAQQARRHSLARFTAGER